jgi:hypothetical protein
MPFYLYIVDILCWLHIIFVTACLFLQIYSNLLCSNLLIKQLFVELSNNVICENAVIIFVFGWEETNEDNTH